MIRYITIQSECPVTVEGSATHIDFVYSKIMQINKKKVIKRSSTILLMDHATLLQVGIYINKYNFKIQYLTRISTIVDGGLWQSLQKSDCPTQP